ncbi:hypothetical protein GCM10009759_38540 [Kitasatospora saccharophila]|uniref:Uncharacterized protein n=1 Tax=Kitasatospora saccharophila TaxID=407973 RepID=A0ABN2X3Z5_9ACTN
MLSSVKDGTGRMKSNGSGAIENGGSSTRGSGNGESVLLVAGARRRFVLLRAVNRTRSSRAGRQ